MKRLGRGTWIIAAAVFLSIILPVQITEIEAMQTVIIFFPGGRTALATVLEPIVLNTFAACAAFAWGERVWIAAIVLGAGTVESTHVRSA